jgi:hypothetical protein
LELDRDLLALPLSFAHFEPGKNVQAIIGKSAGAHL